METLRTTDQPFYFDVAPAAGFGVAESTDVIRARRVMQAQLQAARAAVHETVEQPEETRPRSISGMAGLLAVDGATRGIETTANGFGDSVWEIVAGFAGQQAVSPAVVHDPQDPQYSQYILAA